VSLLVWIFKKLKSFGFQIFCGWRHKWDRFRHFRPR